MKKEEERFAPSGAFEGMLSLRAVIDTIERGESDRVIKRVLFDEACAEKKARELSYLRIKSKLLGFPLEMTNREHIDEAATGGSHGGIVAFCGERTLRPLSPDFISEQGFYLMLDGIEDPYNFGYALRSVYAAGADGVVIPPRNWMSAAGVVCRASAGASERATLMIAAPEEAAKTFHRCGFRVVCADINDSLPVYESNLMRPLLLIVGGEKRGISRTVLEQADAIVRLDYGRAFPAALSAASAAAILAFEVFRQNKPE